MALIGERIGAYEIVRLIARGGMATVYEARQPALGRLVALKRLDLRTDDPTLVDRFIRESQIGAAFDHPNIVTVFDFFEADGVPYIAMEYLPRGSLRPFIGRLAEPQVFGVLEGMLAGLEHAEEHGVAHRDLKPENVLVTQAGAVKLADFGIAKAYKRVTERFTADGTAVGTPVYMAPEQVLARELGPCTDLYAVGVVAYELLSGVPPFDSGDAPAMTVMYRHVNETPPPLTGVDQEIGAWVAGLLEKAPDARPAGAADAWNALEEIVVDTYGPYWRRDAGLPGDSTTPRTVPWTPQPQAGATTDEATPPEPTEVQPPPHRSGAGRIAAAAGVVAAGVAVAAAVALTGRDPPPPSGSNGGGATAPTRAATDAALPFDFDGDGTPTLSAGRPGAGRGGAVVVGSRRVTPAAPQRGERFGAALASADFDHDGYADLAIGAPRHNAGRRTRLEGAVTVIYGSRSGLARRNTVTGPGNRDLYSSARFGTALAAGDLDGDGYGDLVVGVPGSDALPDEDRASGDLRLLFGSDGGLGDGRMLRRPRTRLGRFGSVVAVGDVDGDDRLDVVEAAAGVPAASIPGHATYCAGGDEGPIRCRVIADLPGGPTALAVGDVTGDGLGDIAAGVPVNTYLDPILPAPAGAVLLWPGTRRGPAVDAVTITQQTENVRGNDQPGDEFGAAVVVADLDRDSFADIVVGTPGEDEAAGRVSVLRGGATGLPPFAGPLYSQGTPGVPGSVTPGNRFGAALALLDPDGDGRRPELLVTAPGSPRSLITLRGRPGGFSGTGASGRLASGATTLQGDDAPPVGGSAAGTAAGITLLPAPDLRGATTRRAVMMDRFRLGTIAVATWMAAVAAPAFAAPPPNDAFDAAAPLGDAPLETSGTNFGASRESGEPLNGVQTVWYAFQPATSRRVAVEVATDAFSERVLNVYSGAAVTLLQPVGSSQGVEARVAFDAVAGETYRISVARTYETGPFKLRIRPMPLPDNDAFDDARTMRVPFVHAGNLADATAELGEDDATRSVWYRFRARRTGSHWLEATGTCATAKLFSGGSVDEMRAVEPRRTSGYRLRRGRIYHASVDCAAPGYGDYELRLSDGSIEGDGVTMEVVAGQTVDSVRSRGLRLSVSAARAVEMAIQLRVSKSTARTLGLESRVIGRLQGRLSANVARPAAVRLSREARRALEGKSGVNATLRLQLPESPVPDQVLGVPVTL